MTARDLDHLAAFPEQNPNLVIEMDLGGMVTYLNPVAASRFPELTEANGDHPLLDGVAAFVSDFRGSGLEYDSREIHVGDAVFEQKVCYTPAGGDAMIRVYSHDITALKRAEREIADLARRVVQTQEEERHRVARELHDEAGQALVALKISLQILATEADPLMRDNLEEAVRLVESTREQIRLLAHGLRPPALDALGLSRSLAQICADTAERTQLQITYDGSEIERLSDEAEISLYRFVQEALTNAVLHSEGKQVRVVLEAGGGEIRLSVTDDGRGMDPSVLDDPTRSGLGIVGMKERLGLLDGRVEVLPTAEAGTTIVAVLPLEPAS